MNYFIPYISNLIANLSKDLPDNERATHRKNKDFLIEYFRTACSKNLLEKERHYLIGDLHTKFFTDGFIVKNIKSKEWLYDNRDKFFELYYFYIGLDSL